MVTGTAPVGEAASSDGSIKGIGHWPLWASEALNVVHVTKAKSHGLTPLEFLVARPEAPFKSITRGKSVNDSLQFRMSKV